MIRANIYSVVDYHYLKKKTVDINLVRFSAHVIDKPEIGLLPPRKCKSNSYFYFACTPRKERGRHLVYAKG
jgi:hypothetical protein